MLDPILSLAIVMFLCLIQLGVLAGVRIGILEIVLAVMSAIISISLPNTPLFPLLNILAILIGVILVYDSFNYVRK